MRRTQTASAWPLPGREAGGTTEYASQAAFGLGGGTNVGQYGTFPHFYTVYAAPSPMIHRLTYALQRPSALLLRVPNNHNPLSASEKCAVVRPLGATNVGRRAPSYDATHAALPALTAGSPIPYMYGYDAFSGPDDRCLGYSAVPASGGWFTSANAGARRRVAEGLIQDPESEKKGVGRGVARVRGCCTVPESKKRSVEIFNLKRLAEWLEAGVIALGRVEVIPGLAAGCERTPRWDVGAKLVVRIDASL